MFGGSPSSWIGAFKKNKQIFSTIFQARISNVLKYFLSETIHAQENGSWGTHFAKSLNSNFLKGLTHSALNVFRKKMPAAFGSLTTQPAAMFIQQTGFFFKLQF